MEIVPILLVVALLVAGAIASAVWARQRRDALAALAVRLNLAFDARRDEDIPCRFGFLRQFSEGSNRYATNILSGDYRGNELLAFDYHYETYTYDKNGRHTHDYWFSVFILEMPGCDFPDLTIRHESFLIKLAEAFGYQDINFESAEFSKAFCVRSPDKKFAYDVCHPRMMEYLLANRDLSLEIENNVLALVFPRRLSVEAFETNLQRLEEIHSRLPEYLFTQKL